MARFVMVCQGFALNGSGPVGQYLKSHNPDAVGGRGSSVWTSDLDQDMRFPSVEALLEEWKRQSRVVPFRDDGRPNRPLTAFTVSTERVD